MEGPERSLQGGGQVHGEEGPERSLQGGEGPEQPLQGEEVAPSYVHVRNAVSVTCCDHPFPAQAYVSLVHPCPGQVFPHPPSQAWDSPAHLCQGLRFP